MDLYEFRRMTVKYANGFPDFKGAGFVEQEINIGEFVVIP